jgi:GH35 family endo-1,4-beta-xylanase
LLKTNPEQLRLAIDGHILETAGKYSGRVVEWDVVNEPYANHDLMDTLGNEEMARWFKLTRQADPKARLYINDYGILSAGGRDAAHHDAYEKTIRQLLAADAPIDGIGMQGHFAWRLTPPTRIWEILDRFAALGLRIQVTEMNINITDTRLQADYTRDLLMTLFAHPAVDGIVCWAVVANPRAKDQAVAMFNTDWTPRPNGQEWLNLVHGQWWTLQNLKTDELGQADIRGFLGSYRVTAWANGRTVEQTVQLQRKGTALTLVMP